jgi:V/A-type H+-transporting ATPase subunit C
MLSRAGQYGYINAKLRARISSMLSTEDAKRLAETRTLHDLFEALRGTPFGVVEETYNRTGSLRATEWELLRTQITILRSVEVHLSETDRALVRSLLTGYEIESLKNCLRLFFSRRVLGRQEAGVDEYQYDDPIVYRIDYGRLAASQSLEDIVEELEGTPYRDIVEEHQQVFRREGTLFPLETALDRFYYQQLMKHVSLLPVRDRKIARSIIGAEIDLLNVSWIIRYRTYYDLPEEKALAMTLPGGLTTNVAFMREAMTGSNVKTIIQKTIRNIYPGLSTLLEAPAADTRSRLLLIEQVLEHILLQEVRKILAGYPFTVGIILAYFVLLRFEYRRIRALLVAKQLELPRERIGEIL